MAPFLKEYHLIYGGDITIEAALAKLSYLIGKGFSFSEIEELMTKNLRGEMTENKMKYQFQLS